MGEEGQNHLHNRIANPPAGTKSSEVKFDRAASPSVTPSQMVCTLLGALSHFANAYSVANWIQAAGTSV